MFIFLYFILFQATIVYFCHILPFKILFQVTFYVLAFVYYDNPSAGGL